MSALTQFTDRVRSEVAARLPALRPNYPAVAVEMDADRVVLVRLRRRGRAQPQLEAHHSRPMPEQYRGATAFRPTLGPTDEIVREVATLFQTTGTKVGRVSLVIPDNLAKISLVHLPERPANRKQLDEIVRFKLRRAVPFRLDDAVLSYQAIPGAGRSVDLLVLLMRRFVVEQYESVLAQVGARVGLVDLCTPNLLNLARSRVAELSGDGGDVALFNFASGYFSLVIVRDGRIIFYRCKSLARGADEGGAGVESLLSREIQNSLAYYQEKLEGDRLQAALVRSVALDLDEVHANLAALGIPRIETLDPARILGLPDGVRLDAAVGQRIAAAVGAATGRA